MFLGIDTSCYTTSVAAVKDGKIISDSRIMLEVAEGKCGLRQSDGVFLHVRNFPQVLEKANLAFDGLKAVSVSGYPRRVDGSYMPVFTAGLSFAKTIAAATGAKLFLQSHQENHISAAVNTTGFCDEVPFIAVHISGGTTELLLCKKDDAGYETEIVGKTLDVSAGQLIDRIGVMGGEAFPAGKHMDDFAKKGDIKLPVSVKGADINFSGAETAAKRMITDENKAAVYYAVFECVAKSLCKSIENALLATGAKTVLMVGGVSSNSVIRTLLEDKFQENLQFCPPQYSTDGAVGNAFLAEKRWNFGEGC